ncbi:MAG: 3-isopropylmalate dehydrogenase [Chloroflexi bacterium]|nr:3-isopropylmalate dehydrogenase [Chloroflexota bacterium]|tara:strand:+ start:2127 stop:3227 length:1101 start_codon:yes stop_codon:yes gene_type:complete
MATFNITVLPGDGIGPEVTDSSQQILDAVGARWKHNFHFETDVVGGTSIDIHGTPLRDETVKLAKKSDAVLFGAVGGPKWDNESVRPEAAILGLRKALGLYANIRPVKVFPGMEDSSPLKNDRVRGADMVILRELTGGLYYAKPKRRWQNKSGRKGVDTLLYAEKEIERIVRVGFELARSRRKKLTSVDKANVLQSSRLWREIVIEISKDYPDVELEHQLVDSCAMLLITRPTSFDVMVMENMFGDIISDEAAVLSASLGMLPSASLAGLPGVDSKGKPKKVRGLYEPSHGSAPDIAGQSKANPIGSILSTAFMLQYSFGLLEEASAVNSAVEKTLAQGFRTADLVGLDVEFSTTQHMTDKILENL